MNPLTCRMGRATRSDTCPIWRETHHWAEVDGFRKGSTHPTATARYDSNHGNAELGAAHWNKRAMRHVLQSNRSAGWRDRQPSGRHRASGREGMTRLLL